jgi:hypothetical protein
MIHTFLDPLVESQFESFLSLIISFLVQLKHLLLPSLIVTSSQVRVGTPLPLLLCCISGWGPESLWQNCIIPVVSPGTTQGDPCVFLGETLPTRTSHAKIQRPKCCLYETPYYVSAPVRETGDVIPRTPLYTQLSSDAPIRTKFLFCFTSNTFLQRHISL